MVAIGRSIGSWRRPRELYTGTLWCVAAVFELSAHGGGVRSSQSVLSELKLLPVAEARCGQIPRPGVGGRSARGGGAWRWSVAAAPLADGMPEPESELCRDPIAFEICF
jgi:hypothetical protein